MRYNRGEHEGAPGDPRENDQEFVPGVPDEAFEDPLVDPLVERRQDQRHQDQRKRRSLPDEDSEREEIQERELQDLTDRILANIERMDQQNAAQWLKESWHELFLHIKETKRDQWAQRRTQTALVSQDQEQQKELQALDSRVAGLERWKANFEKAFWIVFGCLTTAVMTMAGTRVYEILWPHAVH